MLFKMRVKLTADIAERIIEISESFDIPARIVGRVEASQQGGAHLTIRSDHGTFEY